MAENGDDQSFPREGRGPNVVIEFESVGRLLSVFLQFYFERPTIVLTSREMQEPLFRFLSFLGFPRGNFPDIRDFVCAGLYYTGDSDHVYCYCCAFHRFQWVSTDNPFDIHLRYFPNCPFFQRNINVNLNAILNLRRQRGPVLIRFEELPGPTLETNTQGVEHETHRQITSRMSQTEEIFETFNLPPANLPDIERLLGTAPSSFGEIITGATTNRNSRVHNMRRLRNIGHEQGIESEATSTNREENDISNDSDNLLQNFSVSVKCESDGNETFRKTMTGCVNEQTSTNFMVPFPSQECSGVCIQPSDSLNCPSVSMSERDEYSITTSQQSLRDNNSSTRVENTDNDYKINIDRRCQSNEGKKECGAVATTNVSDGLVFNNHNAQDENLDDDNTQNLEARDQPVKAKADSAKAATTKEADDDNTHNLEARCQSVEEKNESGKAAANNESSVLESNNNDAVDENHLDAAADDDVDTPNSEARDQPVKAMADSTKAATTKESRDLELNNNDARVDNINDEQTHKFEARSQSVEEKNESGKAEATKESSVVLVSNHNDVCDENHNGDNTQNLKARDQPVKAKADSTKAETTKESGFLKLKNNDTRVENLRDDKTHNLEASCQSIQEKNESGKAAATNESGDENHDDDDAYSLETRDQPVMAKADSTIALITKESDFLELNNKDPHIKNHRDNKLNSEARFQSDEENNEFVTAVTTTESPTEKHNETLYSSHEEMISNTTELIFQEVTRTEHTVMHDEDGEFVCGRPQGNQEVTEISEAISIAENNLQAINSLHSHIQNDEAIHGLPHDSIEGVEETHRQIDKDRNALSSAETDRLPMSNIAAKRDENMNGNEGMVRRQNVCIVSDLGNSNIIDDKTGPQKILHRKTRTGEEASASMEQTDSKRNKAFSPSQTVVLPADEDGSISPRKDSMTAEIGSKKECLTSQTVQLTEVEPERETVDLKEVHTGYHPTATPTTSTHHNEQVTDEEESVAENDGNVISSSVTDKLPMSDIATKREGNRNINEGMLQRKNVGKEKNLEGPQKTVHEKTRTGEEVGATMEQTDSKRNKAFSPTPTVVLPAGGDGAMFSGKDSMTAEIGSKKKCFTSKKAKPLKEEPDRQTVDLKEVHSSHHPTETPTANSENIEDFCMRIRDILAKIDDPLEKSKKQEEIMTILGN